MYAQFEHRNLIKTKDTIIEKLINHLYKFIPEHHIFIFEFPVYLKEIYFFSLLPSAFTYSPHVHPVLLNFVF